MPVPFSNRLIYWDSGGISTNFCCILARARIISMGGAPERLILTADHNCLLLRFD
ncbi:hypothetical protein PEC301899_05520 [Pectobacterium carotovorum subsp. carotovorum]|nr:hypothetical protein PEC301899_05520 [Pectobacterium carotovorum subsp. carotovorum]